MVLAVVNSVGADNPSLKLKFQKLKKEFGDIS